MSSKTKSVLLTIALAAAMPLLASRVSFAQGKLPTQPVLPLEMALQAASTALAKCEADGYRVSVAVVDRSGVTKVLLRGDGSGPHTISASQRKAFTSASLGQPTQNLVNAIANNPQNEGLRDLDDRILILGGGLPIRMDNQVVGGIGVGGAPSGAIDEACAQAALDEIGSEPPPTPAPTPTPKK